ncbi:MAG: flagellar motor protein MotB [Burkholderiales bacterium]
MSGSGSGGNKAKPAIIIKRIKKVQGGHHGGNWKIAYADFVTAMMAFFLLMWLLGSTTKGDLKGIAEFFANPLRVSMSGGSGTGDSRSVMPGGGSDITQRAGQTKKGEVTTNRRPERNESRADAEVREMLESIEKQRLEALKQKVEEALSNTPRLAEFKNQVLLDITSEGLRIQIIDQQNRPMFDSGKAMMRPHMRELLREIAPMLNEVNHKVTLLGHTDSAPFAGGESGYSNWELSADRANASRRELVSTGLSEGKIVRVAGLASSIPFVAEDPLSPLNRRISIIVMNKKAEDTMYNRSAGGTESSNAEEFGAAIGLSGKSYEQMSPLERVHEAAKMAEQMKRGN